MTRYTLPFEELNNTLVKDVGGKNASLGEMFRQLRSKGIRVPDGFATTAEAYWEFLRENHLEGPIKDVLGTLDREQFTNLASVGEHLRKLILEAALPAPMTEAIRQSYRELKQREKNVDSVAVRSSATAEDLPEASFAGQHDSFLNVSGDDEVVQAVHQCIASLFTDRAIKYREDHGFDHTKIALSAGVQKMVRADIGCAGVAFTIEPETGLEQIIFINGSWGLGDNVVGGVVNADQFYLYKKNLRKGCRAILSKELGSKEKTLVYGKKSRNETKAQNTANKPTPKKKQAQFVLTDDELEELGNWCLIIEEHYDKPMDIEWAKDGKTDELYIVQARPETVHSGNKETTLKSYQLKEKGEVIVRGVGIGNKIAAGKARILHSPQDSDKLQEGEVLVTEITNPDWDPIMHRASAIITNSGGRTSHAAIVSRELGAVAVVGTGNATEVIGEGEEVTVSTAEGTEGKIYKGRLDWEETEIDLQKFGSHKTEVMLIMADPKQAFQFARYPIDGVGLTRLEFTINNSIKVHPLALARFDSLKDKRVKAEIEKLTAGYASKEEYFTGKLSMAVATIAAAFYPRPVIVRMSDFKSNEYANLLGGKAFEPQEENPMLGFRGASRYYSEQYKDGFKLECEAMRKVIHEMQLNNVILMVPFCRTAEEGKEVLQLMEKFGLKRGENGLKIYMMVELPSNVIGLETFAEVFDGFSIGSNDLTQLTLGVDRDSELVSDIFDERNAQVKEVLAMAIRKARKVNRKIGLCGQAPSDFPEVARFLVECGIDSISFNPDALAAGFKNVIDAEKKLHASRHN